MPADHKLPPAMVEVELEEKDVHEDVLKAMEAMSKIRNETIANRNITDEQRDEYLHLAYRLASGVEGIADNDLIDKMQKIGDKIAKNPLLIKYDPLQDRYWQRKDSEFSETLEGILVSITKEGFSGARGKHHLLQAIKYIGASGEEQEAQMKIYDTILPYNGAVDDFGESRGALMGLASFLFGERCKVEKENGLTLKVVRPKKLSYDLVELARDMGYTRMKLRIDEDEINELKSIDEIEVCNTKKESEMTNEKKNKLRKLIGKSALLSYPLIGTLPRSMQERVLTLYDPTERRDSDGNKYSEMNNKEISLFFYSSISEAVIGIGTGLYGIFSGNTPFTIVGASILGDTALKFGLGMKTDKNYGSALLKPFMLPLEVALKNGKYEAEIKFLNTPDVEDRTLDVLRDYETLAQLVLSEDIENSLVWGTQNNSAFGKKLVKNFKDGLTDGRIGIFHEGEFAVEKKSFLAELNGKIPINPIIDKKTQSVIFPYETEISGYEKDTYLYCFRGARYLVTKISRSDQKEDSDNNKIADILSSNTDEAVKAQNIFSQYKPTYLHLRKYEGGKLSQDFEITA